MNIFHRRRLVAPLKTELPAGVACWACYLVVIPFLLTRILALAVQTVTAHNLMNAMIAEFVVDFVLVLLVLRKFLWRSLEPLRGRVRQLFVTALLGLVSYYLLMELVSYLIWLLPIVPDNRNNATVQILLNYRRAPMLVCTVLLAPVTEECLVRGLIFAPLCRRRPWLAYLISVPLFALLHVYAYIGQQSAALLAISFLQYLPAGLVLGWAYQRIGSVFGPILLHSAINLISALFMLS